jgi:hypothetical protein
MERKRFSRAISPAAARAIDRGAALDPPRDLPKRARARSTAAP